MKNKQRRELAVCGFEAVKALAERHPDAIQRLFFTQARSRAFGPVCKALAASRRLYRLVESESELEKLCQSVHHQGVVAMIAEPEIPRVDRTILDAWRVARERVLVLDRVGNANNLGAIVRSAAFFGISKIVIGEDDEQAEITTSSYRVAQGGMELVEVFRAPSARWLVEEAAGKMTRIGADHRARNRLQDLSSLVDPETGILVVLGNEESGLSSAVQATCDHLVRIPGTGELESLNVAQAATLFLYELAGL
ncbi:MAG TPA: RNA methyltransferase [Treponemataceae bacterium]|jgi:TrmH RNA methyltransferase|nr:RNA methyltransferase [Treponemataceae bacterium]